MATLRTLVVTLAPLLRELVTNVLPPQISVEVIEVFASRDRVAERLRDLAPDLIIVGLLDAETDAVALPLLAAWPMARVLVLALNGEHAWLHEPGRSIALLNLSAHGLREALRSTAPGLGMGARSD